MIQRSHFFIEVNKTTLGQLPVFVECERTTINTVTALFDKLANEYSRHVLTIQNISSQWFQQTDSSVSIFTTKAIQH